MLSRLSRQGEEVGVDVRVKHPLRVLYRLTIAAEKVEADRRSRGPFDDARYTVTQEIFVRDDAAALEARLCAVSCDHVHRRNALQDGRQLLLRLRRSVGEVRLWTRRLAPPTTRTMFSDGSLRRRRVEAKCRTPFLFLSMLLFAAGSTA